MFVTAGSELALFLGSECRVFEVLDTQKLGLQSETKMSLEQRIAIIFFMHQTARHQTNVRLIDNRQISDIWTSERYASDRH